MRAELKCHIVTGILLRLTHFIMCLTKVCPCGLPAYYIRHRLLRSYEICLYLSEGETVQLVLSVWFICTMKLLLLTHLSLNISCFYFLFDFLSFSSSLQFPCFFFSVSSRVLNFTFCHIPAASFSLFSRILTAAAPGNLFVLFCVCVYFLFTSVLLFCICEICSRCSYNSI